MKNTFLNHNDLLINLRNTEKYIYAQEIYYNISNKKSNCCNPHCRKYMEEKAHFLFDSYYCSYACQNYMYSILHKEWFNINS